MRSPNAARVLDVIVGIWLFVSAFAWPHTKAEMTNTWILGVLTVVFALVAMYAWAQARFLNTLLAVWLFISALALTSDSAGTVWNNVLCAIAIFALSLVPGGPERTTRTSGGAGGVVRRPA